LGKLANISGHDAVKAFGRAGWATTRRKGSHVILHKTDMHFHLTVPDHREVKEGLLRSLIADAGLTVDEFLTLL